MNKSISDFHASHFKGEYNSLEIDRYFSTIWVELPSRSKSIIRDLTGDFEPYCNWLSAFSKDRSKCTPHISLRYLGFSDELDFDQIKEDKGKFKKAVEEYRDINLRLGGLSLYIKKENGKRKAVRINWDILNGDKLVQIHKRLLKIPGYYFFRGLEGKNFTPHISLGSVDLSAPGNYKNVFQIIECQEVKEYSFRKKKFAINLAKKERGEVVFL